MAMAPSTSQAVATAECTICLAEFADGDDAVRVMPFCRHRFHASCIERWLAGRGRRSSCPTCRAPATGATAAAAAARSGDGDGDDDCAQHVAFAILAGLQLIAMMVALVEATVRYFQGKE